MTHEDLVDMLIRHEGLKLFPYKDTVDKWTIGVGRNISDNGITHDEAMMLLQNDIERATHDLLRTFPIADTLDNTRFCVLVNMCFNIGSPRLKGFQKMWAAIDREDYEDAAMEMLDSKWARQVGSRARELAELMRKGDD